MQETIKVLETIYDHIQQTETNFKYSDMIIPKEDVLKYIQSEIDRLNELIQCPRCNSNDVTEIIKCNDCGTNFDHP